MRIRNTAPRLDTLKLWRLKIESWRLTLEPGRLTMEPWRSVGQCCRFALFDEDRDPHKEPKPNLVQIKEKVGSESASK
jgi:hypothetical protein